MSIELKLFLGLVGLVIGLLVVMLLFDWAGRHWDDRRRP